MISKLFLDKLEQNFYSSSVRFDHESDRLFGVELEFSLVNLFNFEAIQDIEVTEQFLFVLAKHFHLAVTFDSITGRPVKLSSEVPLNGLLVFVSPDFSTSTFEISTSPTRELGSYVHTVDSFVRRCVELANKNNLHLLGCGVHPFSTPSVTSLFVNNSRYTKVKSEELPSLMFQALHFTCQVNPEEMMTVYSTLNQVIPYFTALFSSSPVFLGESTGSVSYRENFLWTKAQSDSRYGFTENSENIREYFEKLIEKKISRIVRADTYLFFEEDKSFRAFLEDEYGKIDSEKTFTEFQKQIFEDYTLFESTVWNHIRFRHTISSIEIRSFDSVPIRFIPAVISLVRGLTANIHDVSLALKETATAELNLFHKKIIDQGIRGFSEKELGVLNDLLEASETGLLKIGEGEQINSLYVFKSMVSQRTTISDQMLLHVEGAQKPEEGILKLVDFIDGKD